MKSKIPAWSHRLVEQLRELRLTLELAVPAHTRINRSKAPEGIVIGMTSYPARIQTAWKAVETLLRQDVTGIPVALVLSAEEFPGKKLPRSLRSRTKRGLHIVWVERNGKSFDKLLPLREIYPEAVIITVDDDKYFPPDTIGRLLEAHNAHPEHIVGTRGWRVTPSANTSEIHFGSSWERSEPGDEGRGLHLPGGNGCLYPPGSLDPIVDNLDLALSLCPTADDIWFWAAAHAKKTSFFCLGMPPHRPVRSQSRTPALSDEDALRSEEQFQSVVNYFGFTTQEMSWVTEQKIKKI